MLISATGLPLVALRLGHDDAACLQLGLMQLFAADVRLPCTKRQDILTRASSLSINMKYSKRFCLFKATTSLPKQCIKIWYWLISGCLDGLVAARRQSRPSARASCTLAEDTSGGLGCLVSEWSPCFNSFFLPAIFPSLLLRHNNHDGDSHLGPVSPYPSLSSLLPTLGSLTPKWRFEAPSESVSFESAATAERRPLSLTESAETRRHGEGTARSRRCNQTQMRWRSHLDVSMETTVTQNPICIFI